MFYSPNTMRGFNRQFRKITKSKAVIQAEDTLFKLRNLASQNKFIFNAFALC